MKRVSLGKVKAPEPQFSALWAYNARGTKPRVHYWPPSEHPYRKALCGAWAHDDLLDKNFGHLSVCPRCSDRKERLEKERSAL